MAELTKDELIFVINILSGISVEAKNANAIQIISTTQSCINKLSKMIDEINPSANIDTE